MNVFYCGVVSELSQSGGAQKLVFYWGSRWSSKTVVSAQSLGMGEPTWIYAQPPSTIPLNQLETALIVSNMYDSFNTQK